MRRELVRSSPCSTADLIRNFAVAVAGAGWEIEHEMFGASGGCNVAGFRNVMLLSRSSGRKDYGMRWRHVMRCAANAGVALLTLTACAGSPAHHGATAGKGPKSRELAPSTAPSPTPTENESQGTAPATRNASQRAADVRPSEWSSPLRIQPASGGAVTFRTGIYDARDGYPRAIFAESNAYRGSFNGVVYMVLAGTSDIEESQHQRELGVPADGESAIKVYTTSSTDGSDLRLIGTYPQPSAAAWQITSVHAAKITLTDVNRVAYVFDLATGTYR
jgi:hypothetical protein